MPTVMESVRKMSTDEKFTVINMIWRDIAATSDIPMPDWHFDILNCRHMANPVTLPTTAMIIRDAGYRCPIIITPSEFLERKEEFGYGK